MVTIAMAQSIMLDLQLSSFDGSFPNINELPSVVSPLSGNSSNQSCDSSQTIGISNLSSISACSSGQSSNSIYSLQCLPSTSSPQDPAPPSVQCVPQHVSHSMSFLGSVSQCIPVVAADNIHNPVVASDNIHNPVVASDNIHNPVVASSASVFPKEHEIRYSDFPGNSVNVQLPISDEHNSTPNVYGLNVPCMYTGNSQAPLSDQTRQKQQLCHLANNPMFQDLRSMLRVDCHAQNTSPSALLASQTASPSLAPVTTRITILNLRFMKNLSSKCKRQVSELQNFYYLKSAELESNRITSLRPTSSTPWILSSINAQFDQQHHELIDRVEVSLGMIEQHLVEMKNRQKLQADKKRSAVCMEDSSSSSTSVSSTNTSTNNPSYKVPLGPVAQRIMSNWYNRNAEHPYPSYEAAEVMATAGGIHVDQVKKWFANRRLQRGDTKCLMEIAKRRKRARTVSKDDVFFLGACASE